MYVPTPSAPTKTPTTIIAQQVMHEHHNHEPCHQQPYHTCFWYAMYSGAFACFNAVASAAMVWLCGPPCSPGRGRNDNSRRTKHDKTTLQGVKKYTCLMYAHGRICQASERGAFSLLLPTRFLARYVSNRRKCMEYRTSSSIGRWGWDERLERGVDFV